MPYPTTAQVAPQRSPLHRTLQDRLDTLARTHRVPGAQLAVDTGTEFVSVHTGTADAVRGTAFIADTAVPLGSVTKTYTAATVMLLIDDEDLDLDESVADVLPEFQDLPKVTVRHLLSHTAGLPTGLDSDTAAGLTASRYLSTVCTAEDALFAPGTDFSYSNAGYVAAGRLIEVVTGMTWHEAVRVLVLEPLGITPSFLGETAPGRPIASGHALNTATGAVRPARQSLAPVEAPAGALLASAPDLLALGRTLIGRSAVVPSATAALMRRPEEGTDAAPWRTPGDWAPPSTSRTTAGGAVTTATPRAPRVICARSRAAVSWSPSPATPAAPPPCGGIWPTNSPGSPVCGCRPLPHARTGADPSPSPSARGPIATGRASTGSASAPTACPHCPSTATCRCPWSVTRI